MFIDLVNVYNLPASQSQFRDNTHAYEFCDTLLIPLIYLWTFQNSMYEPTQWAEKSRYK